MLVPALTIFATLSAAQPAGRCVSDMLPSDGTRSAKPARSEWNSLAGRPRMVNSRLHAFLWGTSRRKTQAEIKSPACALTKTAEVMRVFSRFAVGEHVFWLWTA